VLGVGAAVSPSFGLFAGGWRMPFPGTDPHDLGTVVAAFDPRAGVKLSGDAKLEHWIPFIGDPDFELTPTGTGQVLANMPSGLPLVVLAQQPLRSLALGAALQSVEDLTIVAAYRAPTQIYRVAVSVHNGEVAATTNAKGDAVMRRGGGTDVTARNGVCSTSAAGVFNSSQDALQPSMTSTIILMMRRCVFPGGYRGYQYWTGSAAGQYIEAAVAARKVRSVFEVGAESGGLVASMRMGALWVFSSLSADPVPSNGSQALWVPGMLAAMRTHYPEQLIA
jgi:hypothetical protein